MRALKASVNFDALDILHREIHLHLDRLDSLARQIEANGVDTAAQHEAGSIESFFSSHARKHHLEEETRVFPSLLASRNLDLVGTVHRLRQDHGWIEEDWLALAPQLRAMAMGSTWIDLAEFQHNAQVFIALCREHLAIEDTLVYPEAKARQSDARNAG